jgi:outer membrane protein OmpA-like peptidoglycan-associated protein
MNIREWKFAGALAIGVVDLAVLDFVIAPSIFSPPPPPTAQEELVVAWTAIEPAQEPAREPAPPPREESAPRSWRVYFGTRSSLLAPAQDATLDQIAEAVRGGNDPIELVGYADPRGDESKNRSLSGRRANSVRAWLAGHGISEERIRVEARGELRPEEPGARGLAEARRVEVHVGRRL